MVPGSTKPFFQDSINVVGLLLLIVSREENSHINFVLQMTIKVAESSRH
jgi:hypothetical protein